MLLSDFDYALPEELIAQKPLKERDLSRLLVVDRGRQAIEHRKFIEILDNLKHDDIMVFNDTRVVATRLSGHKDTGGKVEVLLMRRRFPGVWEAMVKPGRRVGVGARLVFDDGLVAEVSERTEESGRVLCFTEPRDPDCLIATIGQTPLPPYIHLRLDEPERYQTVYATVEGSAAAPTAGLHFSERLLGKIDEMGIRRVFVTLHIGVATFRPVRTENVDDHEMHSETLEISDESAEAINSARGRIICVGTTTARALESAAIGKRRVSPMTGGTRLFMRPPYDFKIVEGLITNFHVPKSTLLMLVSAFAGIDLVKRAYAEAIHEQYRFLSFGDAMFLF